MQLFVILLLLLKPQKSTQCCISVTSLKNSKNNNVINIKHETHALGYTFKAGNWQIKMH